MACHADHLAGNVRMAMPLQTLKKMEPGKVPALRAQAAKFMGALDRGEVV